MARGAVRRLAGRPRVVLLTVVLALALVALVFFSEVLPPFVLGVAFAYVLAPAVRRLERLHWGRRRLPRGMAVLLSYTVLLGVVAVFGVTLIPRLYSEINRVAQTMPRALGHMEQTYLVPLDRWLNERIASLAPEPVAPDAGAGGPQAPVAGPPRRPLEPPAPDARPWQQALDAYTFVVERTAEGRYEVRAVPRQPPATAGEGPVQLSGAVRQLWQASRRNAVHLVLLGRDVIAVVVSSLFTVFLALMIAAFLLLSPGRFVGFVRSVVPPHARDAFDDWLARVTAGLNGVLGGQAIICAVNAVLTALGLAVLGVPFWFTLSVFAGVLSLIPFFGVLLSSVPIVLMALTISLETAALALGWIVVVQLVEGHLVQPRVMSMAANIHPVLVIFAMLVGGSLAGVLGALLAVPAFSLVQSSVLFLKARAERMDEAGQGAAPGNGE